MTHYIFTDVETTGVAPGSRVVEIAWIVTDSALNEIQRAESLINPMTPIPAAASGIHGIVDSDVANSPTIEQFMSEHGTWFDRQGAVLVCHNVAFDRRFVGHFLAADHRTCCTLRLARRFIRDAENHKLQTLRYHIGLDAGSAHSAMGDVRCALHLFKWFVTNLEVSPDELVELSNGPIPMDKMPFGKYKNVPLRQVPGDYVRWLLRQENIDADLRAALQTL